MAAKKTTPKAPVEEPETPATEPEPVHKDWRDPDVTFAPDDDSLEAQMWRLGNRQATTGTR